MTTKTMHTAADAIRRLMLAHFKGDEAGFRAVAGEYAEKERRLNHHTLANELERILSEANGLPSLGKEIFAKLGGINGNLPRDKERNAPLVELADARRELDDLVLAPPVRESINRIVTERRGAELLGSYGMRPAGKVLFCGPPGCGKSVAAEALARELYLPLATVRFDAVVSSYLGETAANLRKVFDFGRSRPMVLLFDEFDAIGKQRTATDEHGELKRVVNSFLQLLDGFHAETLTIAATNHQGMLDPALWRRFDEIVSFPLPSPGEIVELFSRHFRQMPAEPSVSIDKLARSLDGLSHADVERIAIDTLKTSILEGRERVASATLEAAISRQIDRVAASGKEFPSAENLKTKGPRGRRTNPRK